MNLRFASSENNMAQRATLRRTVMCSGVGLHSGRPVELTLSPAAAGQGIVFRRSDCLADIPARIEALSGLDHATTLSAAGVSVETVEHLLSALAGLGVDDALVTLDGPEVPILDGSAAPFVERILSAGLRRHDAPRSYIEVLEPIALHVGSKSISISPAADFRVTYTIGFDHPQLHHQSLSLRLTPESYAREIAPARTFGFMKDVDTLRRSGLARGGSLDNAVVYGDDGALTPLRFEDECVRHKILDAVGDLALLGAPLLGHLEVVRGGHALHTALARKLLDSPHAWRRLTAGERYVPERTRLSAAPAV